MKTEKDYIAQFENITGNDVFIFEDLTCTPPDQKMQSENYVTVLCTSGKAECVLEGKKVHISKNDLILCHPKAFINNVMVNLDFRCQGLIMTPKYFETMLYVDGNCWDINQAIAHNPVIRLTDEQMDEFIFDYSIIKRKLGQTHLKHYQQIVKHMLQTLLFEFYDYLAPSLQLIESQQQHSSAEIIFKRFTQILYQESPIKRDVSHYADKLCITSKYLSAICKKQSGNTATEIINSVTMSYIRNMLTSSDKGIKEIAADTGFDNLSFFGKFVKRELGMSPREYRAKG